MRGRQSWLAWVAPLALAAILGACAPAAPTSPATAPAPAVAPTTAVSPELQAIVEAARQEGQLTLIWGEGTLGGTEGVQRIADGLNRRYGLNLNVQFTPGAGMAPMTTKLTEELKANLRASSDVMVGYGNHMAELSQAGVLIPVDWLSWAPHVRNPELLARNGEAVTVQTSYTGIIYNTQRVTANAIPRTMQDLLKPEYKGRLASTPYGAMFDYLATDEVWGEERTLDYVTRLTDQLAGVIRCNEMSRLVSGEFDLFALACSQSNAYELRAQGAPVDIVIAADAPFLIPLYLGVPRNAAHPNAAKLWIDYVLSRVVQQQFGELDHQDLHLLEGSKTAQQLDQLRTAGVRFTIADVDFVLRQDDTEYGRRRTRIQQMLSGR